ncbi:MAG: HAD-IC family P-type ATPase, partial [Clostridia bacterium]|nr:HAD-IC family P-type ATPase [Clostridia bacterium]
MSKIVYRGKSDDKPEKPTQDATEAATAEKPETAKSSASSASKNTGKVTAKATPVKKATASASSKPATKTVTAKAAPAKKGAENSDKPAPKTVTAKAKPRRAEDEIAADEKPAEEKHKVKAQGTIKKAKPKVKETPDEELAEALDAPYDDESAEIAAASTAAVQDDDDEIAEGNVSTQREGVGLTDTLSTDDTEGDEGGDVASEKNGFNKEKIVKYFKRHPKLKINTKVDRFEPELNQGLNAEQVQTRFKQYLFNDTNKQYSKSYLNIFLSNIFTFFNLLCIIAAIFLGIAGVSSISSYLVILILTLNVTIGIIQEIRSKIAVDKLSILATSATKTIRDGETVEIPTKEIVLDDVIIMELGNQVPADCTLADGSVEVNESLLTGESVAIKKQVGDILYAGSFISSGNGKCRVDKVGKETYLEKLSEKAKKYKSPNSELMKSIRMFIKVISIIIIPIAIGVFFVTRSQDPILGVEVIENWLGISKHTRQAIAKTCTVVIGMIPSGLVLLTSVALAVGIVRLARNNTLVREMYSLEMLARVNVLCLDKTGTITDGRMKVNDAVILNTVGEYSLNEIMGSINAALDENNQTSIALFNHFGHSDKLAAVTKIPFSSKRKLSAVTFADVGTFVLGAPEFVLKPMPLKVERIVKQYAQMGLRVVVLAHSSTSIMNGDKLPAVLKPIAIISIADNIREDAIETIKWFKENDVQVKVISGDNPITVSEVAKRAGIDHADKFISLDGLNDKEVENVANKYTVFGRVTPEQKAILVRAIKTEGNTVAMTGDGVNDILALKEADCAISVASGSEAARNVSHLVLMDNNFGNMPKVVAEG